MNIYVCLTLYHYSQVSPPTLSTRSPDVRVQVTRACSASVTPAGSRSPGSSSAPSRCSYWRRVSADMRAWRSCREDILNISILLWNDLLDALVISIKYKYKYIRIYTIYLTKKIKIFKPLK